MLARSRYKVMTDDVLQLELRNQRSIKLRLVQVLAKDDVNKTCLIALISAVALRDRAFCFQFSSAYSIFRLVML